MKKRFGAIEGSFVMAIAAVVGLGAGGYSLLTGNTLCSMFSACSAPQVTTVAATDGGEACPLSASSCSKDKAEVVQASVTTEEASSCSKAKVAAASTEACPFAEKARETASQVTWTMASFGAPLAAPVFAAETSTVDCGAASSCSKTELVSSSCGSAASVTNAALASSECSKAKAVNAANASECSKKAKAVNAAATTTECTKTKAVNASAAACSKAKAVNAAAKSSECTKAKAVNASAAACSKAKAVNAAAKSSECTKAKAVNAAATTTECTKTKAFNASAAACSKANAVNAAAKSGECTKAKAVNAAAEDSECSKPKATTAAAAQACSKPKMINASCPFSGEDVQADAVATIAVGFCNASCRDRFETLPAAERAKIVAVALMSDDEAKATNAAATTECTKSAAACAKARAVNAAAETTECTKVKAAACEKATDVKSAAKTSACSKPQAVNAAKTAETCSKAKTVQAMNDACPMSGRPVKATAVAEFDGKQVGFCNERCRDHFDGLADEKKAEIVAEVAETEAEQAEG